MALRLQGSGVYGFKRSGCWAQGIGVVRLRVSRVWGISWGLRGFLARTGLQGVASRPEASVLQLQLQR